MRRPWRLQLCPLGGGGGGANPHNPRSNQHNPRYANYWAPAATSTAPGHQ